MVCATPRDWAIDARGGHALTASRDRQGLVEAGRRLPDLPSLICGWQWGWRWRPAGHHQPHPLLERSGNRCGLDEPFLPLAAEGRRLYAQISLPGVSAADGTDDVADFRDVDPRIGTVEQFQEMTAKLKEAGIKVIVDLVPNHASSEHPWFQAALAAPSGSPERARFHFLKGEAPSQV